MNNRFARIGGKALQLVLQLGLFVFLLLLTAAPGAAVSAQADTPTPTLAPQATTEPTAAPTDDGALTIMAVQPGTVVNDVQVELIVTGRGFVDGSVVVLNNFGGLETFFVSGRVLRATV
nr:hypothetical protein [Promineifilum sp.]